MQGIEEKFALILKYMGIPVEQIRMEASFVKDFDFEDFQFTCLVFYIGSYFKINVTYVDLGELTTIGNTINFVQRKLQVHFRLNEHDFEKDKG
jgi:acyl carrier protein